jgi:hypothetical protein
MRDFDFHATHFSISEIIMDQGIFCATRFFACEDSASISSKKLVLPLRTSFTDARQQRHRRRDSQWLRILTDRHKH